MKTQYIIDENEYNKLQSQIENIDANLGSIFNHPNDKDWVLKKAVDIDKCLNFMREVLKEN